MLCDFRGRVFKIMAGFTQVSRDVSDVGDFMMVTDLRCWRQNRYVGDFLNV